MRFPCRPTAGERPCRHQTMTASRGLALLTMMERIRAFEEQACLAGERDGLVLGAIHL